MILTTLTLHVAQAAWLLWARLYTCTSPKMLFFCRILTWLCPRLGRIITAHTCSPSMLTAAVQQNTVQLLVFIQYCGHGLYLWCSSIIHCTCTWMLIPVLCFFSQKSHAMIAVCLLHFNMTVSLGSLRNRVPSEVCTSRAHLLVCMYVHLLDVLVHVYLNYRARSSNADHFWQREREPSISCKCWIKH